MQGTDRGLKREVIYMDAAAETTFGFAEAVVIGDTVHVSGQIGLDEDGNLASPAPLGPDGRPTDLSGMEEQMRRTYVCAEAVLKKAGAGLEDVVSETLFVLDVPKAFEVAGRVRKHAYGTDRPPVASNLFGISGLAVPGQLIEITFVAVRGSGSS